MHELVARVRSFWRGFRRPARFATEMDEEMRFHIEMEAQRLASERGLPPHEALRQAAIAFGGVEKRKEEGRDARGLGWISGLSLDLKLGARMLVKYPGLALVGGIGLAVAIAIGAGFFWFIGMMSSSLPLDEGDRIVALENWDVEVNNEEEQSLHDFVLWREEMQTVREISAFRTVVENLAVPGGSSGPVSIAEMSASGFEVARVAPALGRPILEEDEEPGAPSVIVISHDVWQTRFKSDPAVIGREVRLGNMPYTIVGVMPEGFAFPVDHDFWTPLRVQPSDYARGEGPEIFIFGRLGPGVSMEEAQADLTAIGQRTAAAFPESNGRLRPAVLPYAAPILDIQGMTRWELSLMQFTASLLLLIVAVNVAILVYARTATRLGEITIRTALGASRRRIAAQLFLEALVLSAAAAVVGLILLTVGVRQAGLILELEMDVPFWIHNGIDGSSVLYVMALAVVAAIIVGVVPAMQATGPRLRARLSALSGGTGMRMGRTWTILIVAQVGIAVAALPIAVAMGLVPMREALTVPTFDASEFLRLAVRAAEEPGPGIDADAYRSQLAKGYADLQPEMVRRLAAEPGISGVTFSSGSAGYDSRVEIETRGPDPSNSPQRQTVRSGRVAINYFDVLGARMMGGREFETGDLEEASSSIIVNQAFVQQVLGGDDALGRVVRYPPDVDDGDQPPQEYEIVGVVEDLIANSVDPQLTPPTIYHPMRLGEGPAIITAHLRGVAATTIAARGQEIIGEIDPTFWLGTSRGDSLYEQQAVAVRLVALIVGLFLMSVILLSAGGIYALTSFTVTRRQREIGIRTALGASPRQVVRTVLSRAAGQLALGLVVGVTGAFVVDTLTSGELLAGNGAVLLPIFAALMIIVGIVAALGPARRGLKTQPMEALRAD